METIKEITFKDGRVLKIYRDDNPASPREDDNNGTMVCLHSRYDLGDKHSYDTDDFAGWDALRAQIEADNEVVAILPLYLLDHSGITMSTQPFGCHWDSGQVGFIFATRENLRELGHADDVDPAKVLEWLRGEVETYDQFLRGDVYGYVLYHKPCDHCGAAGKATDDSCWGFYGDDFLENGILDNLPQELEDEAREALK